MKNFAKRISALVLAVVVSAAVLCPAAFAAQLPSLPKDQCVVDGAGVLADERHTAVADGHFFCFDERMGHFVPSSLT